MQLPYVVLKVGAINYPNEALKPTQDYAQAFPRFQIPHEERGKN